MDSESKIKVKMCTPIAQLNGRKTDVFSHNQFSWHIETKQVNILGTNYLAVFVECNKEQPDAEDWSCVASVSLNLLSYHGHSQPLRKKIPFFHFNNGNNKRGCSNFTTWSNLGQYASDNDHSITIEIQIQAVVATNDVRIELVEPMTDEQCKVRATFVGIRQTHGIITPRISYKNNKIQMCILKRPHNNTDYLWFYIFCTNNHIQKMHWSYQIRLLTANDEVGVHTTPAANNKRLMPPENALGAPFISLAELFAGGFIRDDNTITIEMDLHCEIIARPFKVRNINELKPSQVPRPIPVYVEQQNSTEAMVVIKQEIEDHAPTKIPLVVPLPIPELVQVKIERPSSPPPPPNPVELDDIRQEMVVTEQVIRERAPTIIAVAGPSQKSDSASRKRKATDFNLKCLFCDRSFFEEDMETFTIGCGHLYCKKCLDYYTPKQCVVCNSTVAKQSCFRLCLTERHDRHNKRIRASIPFLIPDADDTFIGEHSLNCRGCVVIGDDNDNGNLFEKEAYAIRCGHLYCASCLQQHIRNRGMCFVCNSTKIQSIPIQFLKN